LRIRHEQDEVKSRSTSGAQPALRIGTDVNGMKLSGTA
jgi:hypothetical protein